MASFASVLLSSANKTIVPWSVVSLDPSQNFGELFRSFQAGKYSIICQDLTAAVLESSGVSVEPSLSLVEKELNTVDVCSTFGHIVKFTVSLDERPGLSSTLDVSKNAFEIMMQSQRRISKPTFPDALVECTKKDKLFSLSVSLLPENVHSFKGS